MLEAYYLQKLFLEVLQGIFEIIIFTRHLVIQVFLVFGNHQVEIALPVNFTKFKPGICRSGCCQLDVWLNPRRLFIEHACFYNVLKFVDLDLFVPKFVFELGFFGLDAQKLLLKVVSVRHNPFALLLHFRLISFGSVFLVLELLSQLFDLCPQF